MIGRLQGRLLTKQPPRLLVDVGGVGYELEAPMSTCFELPEIGAEVVLVTHLSIREDAHVLFGFLTEAERRLFRDLIRISGVGPKLALAVQSSLTPQALGQCVAQSDVTALTKVPGVGKKTAERLIVELRDKLGGSLDAGGVAVSGLPGRLPVSDAPDDEASSALMALGYKPAEVSRLLKSIDTKDLTSEQIIRLALQGALR